MRQVEFLLIYSDKTWDKELVDVPTYEEDRDNGVRFHHEDTVEGNLVDWANKVLAPQEKYRNVILFAPSSINPESAELHCSCGWVGYESGLLTRSHESDGLSYVCPLCNQSSDDMEEIRRPYPV